MNPFKPSPSYSVNLCINSKVSETEAYQICNNDFKYLLKDYKFVGTLTKIEGILVIYNKHLTKIKNLKVIHDGELFKFSLRVNNVWVNTVSFYAPPDNDDPSLLLEAKKSLDSMENDYGTICGDLNTTLDTKLDCFG